MKYRNLVEVHRVQAERMGPLPALRYKRFGLYHDVSWEQYRVDALACAAALVESGIQPGERVGLLAENRVEWLIADMGLMTAGAVNVSPHAPLTARQIQFQLQDAGARWLFVSNRDQLNKILQVRDELPALQGIVVFDHAALESLSVSKLGIQSWAGFLQHGRRILPSMAEELARRERLLGLESLATVMYTSGTTGNPKGVMLTHGNLLSNTLATLAVAPIGPHCKVLNWLPFSHIYARTVEHYQTLAGGIPLCLVESTETIVQNLEEIQPTHMASVPRFYEKLLTAVTSSDTKKTYRSLRDVFGPGIEWLSSGGAPLSRPIADVYFRAGLPVYQGYGLTESSPVITFNRKSHNKIATVGLPLPGVDIAIAPDGEILSRGPHIMKGYWNNPQATEEAIKDGWLYTGDLGTIDADGYLTITGRKKELMVLSNGKKVVPSYLEGLLLGDDCIDQAVICGEGKSYLTALVVPHWDNVRKALPAESGTCGNEAEVALTRRPVVLELLRERIDSALRDVSCWEQVKKILILPTAFTVAGDELTVSPKLRRSVIQAKYAAQIDALYRE